MGLMETHKSGAFYSLFFLSGLQNINLIWADLTIQGHKQYWLPSKLSTPSL